MHKKALVFLSLFALLFFQTITFKTPRSFAVPDQCEGACVYSGPRLAEISAERSVILNALLGSLTDSNINLALADWNALASTEINLDLLLTELQADLALGSPNEALTTEITLTQFLNASIDVLTAEGEVAAVNALNTMDDSVDGLAGTYQLADFLDVDFDSGYFSSIDLHLLDFVTGNIQIYNYENALVTPQPITINGADLGIDGSINSIEFFAQVVEPPTYVCGYNETNFYSTAIRIKLDIDIVDVNLNTDQLELDIEEEIALSEATIDANITEFHLYLDVAQASGTIELIDNVTQAVNIDATPSLVDLYIGSIPDGVFFDRSEVLDETDFDQTPIGTFEIRLEVAFVEVVNTTVNIQTEGHASGENPEATDLDFAGAYPETQHAEINGNFLNNINVNLIDSLDLDLDQNFGYADLDNLKNDTILPELTSLTSPVLTSNSATVLTNLANETLYMMGITLGRMYVTVHSLEDVCIDPAAVNDTILLNENTDTDIDVPDNDSDADGILDLTTVTIIDDVDNGSTAINPVTGIVTYSPDQNFSGADSFTYTINDNDGETSNIATVNITVNDSPIAAVDTVNIDEDNDLDIDVPANDSDTDGALDLTTVTIIDDVDNGSTAIDPVTGIVTYSPDENFNGADSFTYTIDDDNSATSEITAVNITVNDINDIPTSQEDNATTNHNQELQIDVAANDSDIDGNLDLTTVTIIEDADNGSTAIDPVTGIITYSPDQDFGGDDSFTYTINDDDGGTSNISTVNISVNIRPVGTTDNVNVDEDNDLDIDVAANDSDPDGALDLTTVTIIDDVDNGSTAIDPVTGIVTYSPDENFNGADSFTYTIDDDSSQSSLATTVNITVNDINDNPTTSNDFAITNINQNTEITLTTNDSDIDGNLDLTTVTIIDDVDNGSTAIDPLTGVITYSPDQDFNGDDSFTYTIDDDDGGTSNISTVNISVNPDSDGDGLTDAQEDLNGDGNLENDDTDGDGIPNYIDDDDDNDGSNAVEEDINQDGNPTNDDTDGDGTPNYIDDDDDNDQIDSATENNSPNNGDSNNDGTPDSQQASVSATPKATNDDNAYLTISTTCGDIQTYQTTLESDQAVQDPYYDYPLGMNYFRVNCDNSATVKLYYHGTSDLSDYTYRKYGPTIPGDNASTDWYDFQEQVAYASEIIDGQQVATATFTLTDGQFGDDSALDNFIEDDNGPAIPRDDDNDGINNEQEDLNQNQNLDDDDADGDGNPAYLDPNDHIVQNNGGGGGGGASSVILINSQNTNSNTENTTQQEPTTTTSPTTNENPTPNTTLTTNTEQYLKTAPLKSFTRDKDDIPKLKRLPRTGSTNPKLIKAYEANSLFQDTSIDHPYYPSAIHLFKEKVISGKPENKLALDDQINRAEIAKILVNSTEQIYPDNYDTYFPDTPKNQWYNPYINFLYNHNILSGYQDGTFGPQNPVTLGELSKLTINSFQLNIQTAPQTSEHWAHNYFHTASTLNLIPEELNNPSLLDQPLTRGQVFEIISRTISYTEENHQTYTKELQISIPSQNLNNLPTHKTLLSEPSVWVKDLTEGAAYYYNGQNAPIIFAHSSAYKWDNNPYGTIFKPLIKNFQQNDTITVHNGPFKGEFQVTQKIRISEDDIPQFKELLNQSDLILFTCDEDIKYRWIFVTTKI